jgi:hypothetical protein
MVKNWRTVQVAVVVTATALALGGGAAAADSGGTIPAPLAAHGWHHPWVHYRVPSEGTFGTVTAVDGATTAGTCGTAGSAGVFTVAAWKDSIYNVAVTAATTFAYPASTSSSFTDVCVGDAVGATGTVADDTVTASKVLVVPVRTPSVPRGVLGAVTVVNGVSTVGTCGTAASSGDFTVTAWKDSADTVDVTATTAFVDPATPTASFTDVCVGDPVGVAGTVDNDTVTASKVFVLTACTSSTPKDPAGAVAPATGPRVPTPALSAAVAHGSSPHASPLSVERGRGFVAPGSWGGGRGAPGGSGAPATGHGFAGPTGGPDGRGTGPGPDGPSGTGGPSGWSGQAHGRS